VFYFTCDDRSWLRVKYNTEIISKLFQCFISHVTVPETEINYFSYWRSSKFISKLFQRQWTCWKVFM